MSFNEKRRPGVNNSQSLTNAPSDLGGNAPRRTASIITMPRPLPPPMASSPTSTSLLTTTTSPSSPSSIPLRRSHSSLNKFPSSVSSSSSGFSGTSGIGGVTAASSQASLVPQRYLEVPDAASMISTHQRRTPSSASLLFGSYSMASTPSPSVSSNSRRLAGNIPGAVIKVKSSSPLLTNNDLISPLALPKSPSSNRANLSTATTNPSNPILIRMDARFPQSLPPKKDKLSKKRRSVESLSGSSNSFVSLTLQRKSTNKACSNGGSDASEHENNENINSQQKQSHDDNNYEDCEMGVEANHGPIIAGSLTTTDKISEFINTNLPHLENSINNHNSELINEPTPMSGSSVVGSGSTSLKRHESASNKKRPSSKGKPTHKPQTQSMSNITVPTLTHSTSDNDLEQNNKSHHLQTQNMSIEPDDSDILDYKDDMSYTSEDNLQETGADKSMFDNSVNNYNQLVTKPINLSMLLKYILCSENESPKNLYFCMFADELLQSNEKKETQLKWMYELYTTFLMTNAPLKLKINEGSCKKLEDIFERSPLDNIGQMKKLFEEIKQEAVEIVNQQLGRFREVNKMGLANLFQSGSDLFLKSSLSTYQQPVASLSFSNKSDQESVKQGIIDSFQQYLNEISKEIQTRIGSEWNGPMETAQQSALISSFITFARRLNLPLKQIGKVDIDKIPSFVSKKVKGSKKAAAGQSNVKGHCFVDCSFLSVRAVCVKCGLPFWGIGYQGMICQKYKCDMKVHRHCLSTSGVLLDCHGSQKTIRSDYKEKLDNIQKMIFGKKESTSQLDQTSASSKNNLFSPTSDQSSMFVTNEDIPIIVGGTNSTNEYDQNGNLPVDIAIKKFESYAIKSNHPTVLTSPPAFNPNASNLARTSTTLVSNSNRSPPSSNINIVRHNSVLNANNDAYNQQRLDSYTISHTNYHQTPPQSSQQQHLLKQQASGSQISILPNKFNNSVGDSGSGLIKEQSCRRVGSLKVDVKKIKSNVTRSKSDPEPDEIKTAMSNGGGLYEDANSRKQLEIIDTPIVAGSSGLEVQQNQSQMPPPYNRSATASSGSPTSTGVSFNFTPSTTNSSLSSSRQSWMNGSDIELDDELPPLNIDRSANSVFSMTDKEIKTQEVINELIHTEQKHVRNLKILKHHFYLPIKINMYLTKEELNVMFPNLEQVLELHSNFNNKLKRLRKENPIVPIKQLINIILEQFKGDGGERFKTECARFCENQSQAMRLLQTKIKSSQNFSNFITTAENHSICRKLQLKDFIPTEVQRLVKYKLLFQELTKNATNQEDREKLLECMDASSEISQYINKAVTECENRKRVEEIQLRMETKEFDRSEYCVKSPLLSQYKNLDLRSRKLIYEGELEWKIHGSVRLMALLFEDILIFLERITSTSNDENDVKTKRYSLRPLVYTINKVKQVFTPVIPLTCINSFRPMHEKRYFHLVVILHDEALKVAQKSKSSQDNPIQTQMLFILIAKSGDERNKWVSYLQALTGKLSQIDKQGTHIDLRPGGGGVTQQSSASSLTSLATTTTTSSSASSSTANLMAATPTPSIKTSLSASALTTPSALQIAPINETFAVSGADLTSSKSTANNSAELEAQLKENTRNIIDLLHVRQNILSKINKTELEENVNATNQPDDLMNGMLSSLTSLSENIMRMETDRNIGKETSTKVLNELLKLEEYASKLRTSMLHINPRLPNLQLPSVSSNELENVAIADEIIMKRSEQRPTAKIVRQMIDSSELVSSSLLSSAASSSNADLSEDEQINYYDDDDDVDNHIGDEYVLNDVPTTNLASNNRSLSTSSDQTLILMNTSETTVNTPKPRIATTVVEPKSIPQKQTKNQRYSEEYDEEEYLEDDAAEMDRDDAEEEVRLTAPFQVAMAIQPSNSTEIDQSVVIKLNRPQKVPDQHRQEVEKNNENLISIKIKPSYIADELDAANKNNNDLSDDEVKEYEQYEDDSNV